MYGLEEISDHLRSTDVAAKRAATSGTVSLFDMLKRYAFSFYEVVVRIEQLRTEARNLAVFSGYGPPSSLTKADKFKRDSLIACLKELRTECENLDLAHTASLILFAESEVQRKGDGYTYVDILKELDTLSFSFAAELRRNSCFRVGPEKDKYFEKDDLFGPEVSKAFRSCADEIRNAGNCYALEQNEASAFHSMKILERGLGFLAKRFAVDFAHTNWHNVIEETEKKVRKMDASFGADWKDQQKFYAQAATHFMFLKDAWRNHIMHIRDVPYDEGRAFSVLDHVRQFMQALAEGGLKE